MPFNREAAIKAGYSDTEIDSYLNAQQNQTTVKGSDWTDKVGNGMDTIGKVVGGTANFFFPQTTKLIKDTATDTAKNFNDLLKGDMASIKQRNKEANIPSPWLSLIPGYALFDKKTGGSAREIATYMAMGKLLPWLTKTKLGGGVAGKATSAAEKATQSGVKVSLQDVVDRITGKVTSKLGSPEAVTTPLKELLKEKIGTTTGTTLTPSELLQWRRQIMARGGSNFLQRIFKGADVGEKVEGVARSEISKVLHQYAPATKLPDLLYRLYSNPILGSPMSAIPKVAGGILGVGSVPSIFRTLTGGGGGGYNSSGN